MIRSGSLTAEAFITRARTRLLDAPDEPVAPHHDMHGDHKVTGFHPDPQQLRDAIPAAVLAPVVLRPDGAHLILTQRSTRLAKHSGQVAFPGGRIDPGETPLEAALREAEEEIGLDRGLVTPVGYMPSYFVGTGYRIIPVVGLVAGHATFTPNPDEVERVFEVSLAELFDESRHRIDSREVDGGLLRYFHVIDHDEAYIWGATAALIRVLSERLSG